MSFSEAEIAYLRSQPLGRLATVSDDGQPDAVPVGFEYDAKVTTTRTEHTREAVTSR